MFNNTKPEVPLVLSIIELTKVAQARERERDLARAVNRYDVIASKLRKAGRAGKQALEVRARTLTEAKLLRNYFELQGFKVSIFGISGWRSWFWDYELVFNWSLS